MTNTIIGNFVDLKETEKLIKLIVVNTEGEYEELLGLKRYGWTTDGFENTDEFSLNIEYTSGNNGAKWLKDSRVNMTPRNCQRYVKVYETFQMRHGMSLLSDLSLNNLYDLAQLPQEDREQMIESSEASKEPYVDNSKPKAEVKVAEGVVTKVEQKGKTYRVTVRCVNGFKKVDTLFITTKYIDVPEGVKVHIEYTESMSEFRGKEQISRWIQNIEILSEKVVVGSHFEIDTKDEIGELLEQFLIENDIHYTKEDKVEYANEARNMRRF